MTFLDDLWSPDEQQIETLQQWSGYLLTPDTRQQKILMLIGPPRSGKGTIMRTETRLLGKGNTCSPSMAQFGEHFGLAQMIDKVAAIVGDARIGRNANVETMAVSAAAAASRGER